MENKSKITYWQVGNVVRIGQVKNLLITDKFTASDGRKSYQLCNSENLNKKYRYSFAGGLVRIY